MTQVSCQHTGIEFEAKSTRSKNHPVVAQLLNDANRFGKSGAYGHAIELLAECREAGMTEIDEIREMVEAGVAEYNAGKSAEMTARKQALKARRKAASARKQVASYVHPDNIGVNDQEIMPAGRAYNDEELYAL